MVCFKCGVYGHAKENCPQKDQEQPLASNGGGGIEGTVDGKEDSMNKEDDDNYGPWMMVQRRGRRVAGGAQGGAKGNSARNGEAINQDHIS